MTVGCTPIKVNTQAINNDRLVRTQEREERTDQVLYHSEITVSEGKISGTASRSNICEQWVDSDYERTVVYKKTLVEPTKEELRSNLTWSIISLGAAAGYAVAAQDLPSQEDRNANYTASMTFAGLAAWGTIHRIRARSSVKEHQERLSKPVRVPKKKSNHSCQTTRMTNADIYADPAGPILATTDQNGDWQVAMNALPSEALQQLNQRITKGLSLLNVVEGRTTHPLKLSTDLNAAVRSETQRREQIALAEKAAADAKAAAEEQVRRAQILDNYSKLPRRVKAYSGPWKASLSISPVDDSYSVFVQRTATGSIRSNYGRKHKPTILFRCKEATYEAYLNTGVMVDLPVDHWVEVILRFDSQPAMIVEMIRSDDGRALFFDGDPESLETLIRTHKKLFVRFPAFNSGYREFTIDLRNSDGALKLVEDACHPDLTSIRAR